MKKWMILVLVFCFGFVELYSQNYEEIDCFPDPEKERLPYYLGFNYSFISSGMVTKEDINTKNHNNYGYGFHLEKFYGKPFNQYLILKYGFNFTNLGYEFEQNNLKQNYDLSYLTVNVNFRRSLYESQFYVIGGVNLNYLYDVESEIETLNSNNEKVENNRDFSGSEISNNYNRFDLVGSIGIGYDINMAGYYISIEPKYNFSFFNHINENNQELNGMNFKNEFWSLNFGVTFAL